MHALRPELHLRLSRQPRGTASGADTFLPLRRCMPLQSVPLHRLLMLKGLQVRLLQPHLSLNRRVPFDLHRRWSDAHHAAEGSSQMCGIRKARGMCRLRCRESLADGVDRALQPGP